MATKNSTAKPKSKRRTVSKKELVKASDWLSFSSAIIAVTATAIFYFAGWVYVSHWYSFYGIDSSELDLPTQLILIHGIPGILVIILTGLVAASTFAIVKYSRV